MRYIELLCCLFLISLSAGCTKEEPVAVETRIGTTTELTEFVDAARAHYVTTFRESAIKYREKFQPSHPEVMMEFSDLPDPVPYRYRRVDLASGAVQPPNVTEVHVEPHRLFQPFTVKHSSGVTVTIYPAAWNMVNVRAAKTPADIEPLTKWVWKWIDDGDTKPQDDVGFSGVIHSVSYPRASGSQWSFTVDFGTAPREAFEDLMASLSAMGIAQVVIESPEK